MTNFVFRLERVLDWRQSELSLEEARTREAAARLAALKAHRDSLAAAALEVARAPETNRSVSGADLAAVEACRRRLLKEVEVAEAKILESGKQLAAQREKLVEARRRLRLLENLKQRRYVEWQAGLELELAELAAESSLARWQRDR